MEEEEYEYLGIKLERNIAGKVKKNATGKSGVLKTYTGHIPECRDKMIRTLLDVSCKLPDSGL